MVEVRRSRGPIDAISYGPFGYLQSAVVGFILGTVLFLLLFKSDSGDGGTAMLPVLLMCAGGLSMLLLLGAVGGNYVIGRRIREARELSNALFAGSTVDHVLANIGTPCNSVAPLNIYRKVYPDEID